MDRLEIESIRAQLKALDEQLERALQREAQPTKEDPPTSPAPPRPLPTAADVLKPRAGIPKPSEPQVVSPPPVLHVPEPTKVSEEPRQEISSPRFTPESPTVADPVPGNAPSRPTPPVPVHKTTPPKSAIDLSTLGELDFGRKVLPIAGGILVLWAIALLIRQAYNAGYFGIEFQYAAALFTSLLLIVVGLRQPAHRDAFGQSLTAVGSTGLHLIAIGAHVQLKLYSGEVLLALTLLISAANLAYSRWRSSRPFLYLGLLGGLAGATLPGPTIALTLVALIGGSGLAISAVRRWPLEIMASWIASIGAIAVLGHNHPDILPAFAPLIGVGLTVATLAAYASATRGCEFETQAWGMLPAQIGTLLLFACPTDWIIHPWMVVLGSAMVVLAFRMGPGTVRFNLFWQGLAIAVAAAQFRVISQPGGLVLVFASALVMLVLARRTQRKEFLVLASVLWVELALLGLVDIFALNRAIAGYQVGLGAAVLIAAALVMTSAESFHRMLLARACLFASAPFWLLLMGGFSMPEGTASAFAYGLAMYAIAVWFRVWFQKLEMDHSHWWAAGMVVLGLMAAGQPLAMASPNGVPLLFGVISLGVVGWLYYEFYSYFDQEEERVLTDFFCGSLLCALLGWYLHPMLSTGFGMASQPAWVFALSLLMLGLGVASARRRAPGLLAVATILGCGVVYLMPMLNTWYLLRGVYIPIGLVQVVSALLLGYGVSIALDRRDIGYGLAAGLAFGPFSLVGYLLFAGQWTDLSDSAAITFAWILYGIIALLAGFSLRSMPVRVAGLLGFGLTALKMVVYDISTVSPMIRVLAIFSLGVVLILAGYAYVRLEESIKRAEPVGS